MVAVSVWMSFFFLSLSFLPSRLAAGAEEAGSPGGSDERVHIELQKAPLEGELPLSLRKAIELALERNPDLIVEKIRIEQAREKIEEEKGNYDPAFTLTGLTGRKDNVVASRFFPTGTYMEEERTAGLGFGGKIYTGGRYGIDLTFQRLKSTSNTQTLSPQYGPALGFTFSHALLRDFGLDVNRTRIHVAEKGEEIAERNLVHKLSRLIQQVAEAYWNLVFFRRDFGVKGKSLEVARGLLKQAEDLLRAGRVASVSVAEARAGVAARDDALIVAETEMKKAEDQLKLLLHTGFNDAHLVPVESPKYEPLVLDFDRSVDLALKQRPELARLEKELEQREMEKKLAYNQTLPRLDFTTQYGMTGLSGRPNKTLVNPLVRDSQTGATVPCDREGTQPTVDDCVSVGTNVEGSVFDGEIRPSDAFNRFFTRRPFDNWSVELKLEIPLWNRTARARLSDANLRLLETKTQIRSFRDIVRSEVRGAVRDIAAARKRIEATRAAVEFTGEQFDGTRKKFDAGLATSYEVLEVLDDMGRAQTNALKAIVEYNVAQTRLYLAEGTILEKHDIELKKSPRFEFRDGR